MIRRHDILIVAFLILAIAGYSAVPGMINGGLSTSAIGHALPCSLVSNSGTTHWNKSNPTNDAIIDNITSGRYALMASCLRYDSVVRLGIQVDEEAMKVEYFSLPAKSGPRQLPKQEAGFTRGQGKKKKHFVTRTYVEGIDITDSDSSPAQPDEVSTTTDTVIFLGSKRLLYLSRDSARIEYLTPVDPRFQKPIVFPILSADSLLCRLQRGEPIRESVIEELDFEKLRCKSGNDTLRINRPLVIENSIVLRVDRGDSRHLIVFEKAVSFCRTTFAQSLSFENTTFGASADFTNTVFMDVVDFSNTQYLSNAAFQVLFCNDVSFYSAKFSRYALFRECKFLGTAYFTNAFFHGADFSDVWFLSNIYFNGSTFEHYAKFDAAHFVRPATLSDAAFGEHADFYGVRFIKKLNREYFTGDMIIPRGPERDSIFDYSQDPPTGKLGLLERVYFADGCLLGVGSAMSHLSIDLENLNRSWIDFQGPPSDFATEVFDFLENNHHRGIYEGLYSGYVSSIARGDTNRLEGKVSFESSVFDAIYLNERRVMSSVIKYVKEFSNPRADLRDEVLNRLDYQIIQLERKNTDLFNRIRLGLLQVLVKNGYHGTENFFISVLVIVLLFAVIYRFGFQSEVDLFIAKESFLSSHDSGPVGHEHQSALSSEPILRIVRALWFSLLLFVTPRFDRTYFRFSSQLQRFIIVEWALGLFMIAIYLIYIATKLSFVKALLGI